MWNTLQTIYGGEKNVLRAKSKSLIDKFDEMRIVERENIFYYCGRTKEVVNNIRGENRKIGDENVISKVLRTLFLVYAIRVCAIQELRYTHGNKLTL